MIEFYEVGAIVARGKLTLEDREKAELAKALSQFVEGFVTVRIERHHRKRTDRQNRFWHGVVIPLFVEHCGYTFDEAKAALALELIPVEARKFDGSTAIVPGHTSDLNVAQFNELIKRAQQLGAEMDIYIPDPNEVAA